MTFKTLTTLVHNESADRDTFEAAIDFAQRSDAHLGVLLAGINTIDPGFYYAGLAMATVSDSLLEAEHSAKTLRSEVKARLADTTISWDQDTTVVLSAGLGQIMTERTRFSDLTILPRPSGSDRGQVDVIALEAALLDSGAPVLVIPPGITALPPAQKILLAWDGGQPALSAARAALPILTAADEVVVTIIDSPKPAKDRPEPGLAFGNWLRRHGVNVTIDVIPSTGEKISDVLIAQSSKHGCDLIVMGGYGHSRTREYVLGGTTRRMLESAPVPLFMAH